MQGSISGGCAPGKLDIGVYSPGLDVYGKAPAAGASGTRLPRISASNVFTAEDEDALLGPGEPAREQ
jgi:glutaminase